MGPGQDAGFDGDGTDSSPVTAVIAAAAVETCAEQSWIGIPEPACSPVNWLRPWQLDLMLLPLVAFDGNGNRLGMGGGFYDRSLAYRQSRTRSLKPKLIGLAHELQHEQQLAANSWDIPLDIIATEERVIQVNG